MPKAGWREAQLFANMLLLLSWAFSTHWSCEDGRLPRVLPVGCSGHPFGISDLDCGERFLVTETRVCCENQYALVRKFWVIKRETPNEDVWNLGSLYS